MPSQRTETQEVIVNIDGGSRGNPGRAAYAVAVSNVAGARLAAFSKFVGHATSNVAEYLGLLAALDYAREHGYSRVKVLSDSELLVRQINGQYKVKNPDLKILHERAQTLIRQFDSFSIKHVFREQNREADRLVNQALDVAEGKREPGASGEQAPRSIEVSATYHQGVLKLHGELPLEEGEEVRVEIRRTR
jgi:ribonuclease HI